MIRGRVVFFLLSIMAVLSPLAVVRNSDLTRTQIIATARLVLQSISSHGSTLHYPNLALAEDGASVLASYNAAGSIYFSPHADLSDGLILPNGIMDCQGSGNPLHPSVDLNRRWCFIGSKGQLGILLSVPGRITNISVSHPPQVSVLPSAPRHIILWGVVDGDANKAIYDEHGDVLQSLRARLLVQGPFARHDNWELIYVPLATFFYNIKGSSAHQVFDVFPEIHELRMDFGIVVVQIVNNWGEAYTGLHHVGIYGERVI